MKMHETRRFRSNIAVFFENGAGSTPCCIHVSHSNKPHSSPHHAATFHRYGLCMPIAMDTIKDTPSAPAPHASAAECECAAGSYGVPGDVHEYRIVRADGRAGPVVFDTVRFLDASGGEVQIYAEDPAPHGG